SGLQHHPRACPPDREPDVEKASDAARRPAVARGLLGPPPDRGVAGPAPHGSSKLTAGQAGFPSGQRGGAVNALALPSQVRILPPPLARPDARPLRSARARASARDARGLAVLAL